MQDGGGVGASELLRGCYRRKQAGVDEAARMGLARRSIRAPAHVMIRMPVAGYTFESYTGLRAL